jgi:uncharacterized protein YlxW (UPF0749 family)
MSGVTRSVWVVVGALVVGFLLGGGVTAGRSAARIQDERKDELIALIGARMERTDALAAQLEELRGRVTAAEAQAAAGLPALRARLADAEHNAGLTRVKGPGLRVVLADAPSPCVGLPENCRILDADLQLALNALFAAGAEAVAVNGERIISTSAVRSAGRSILVNYRVLASPYTIDAVGDPDLLPERFGESTFAADFALWKDRYGLGFSMTALDDVDVPAFSGSVRLRTAVDAQELGGDQ